MNQVCDPVTDAVRTESATGVKRYSAADLEFGVTCKETRAGSLTAVDLRLVGVTSLSVVSIDNLRLEKTH